jgi:serpin B
MPYAGEAVAMLVLLPREAGGLAAIETSLTPASLKDWTGRLRQQEVEVFLPKFKLTSQFDLNAALQSLGMVDAFEYGKADFAGMDGTRWLFISAAVHKAFVEVNEEGTEAAAATGVAVATRAMLEPLPTPVFRADHPFLFLIRERSSGAILFMGRLENPRAQRKGWTQ